MATKKWRYTLWDLDAIMGHYINYTGILTQAQMPILVMLKHYQTREKKGTR